MSARYSSKCMLVHSRGHSFRMKLGGTAEVYLLLSYRLIEQEFFAYVAEPALKPNKHEREEVL